jgi:hypothetical protein
MIGAEGRARLVPNIGIVTESYTGYRTKQWDEASSSLHLRDERLLLMWHGLPAHDFSIHRQDADATLGIADLPRVQLDDQLLVHHRLHLFA